MAERSCPPGCGACCDPILLVFTPAEMTGPSGDFCREHWHDVTDEYEITSPDLANVKCVVRCDVFDPVTRACTDYENRPPICRHYPWYGKSPTRDKLLNPACVFHADVRTMLPIAEVNHGRR